MKETLRDRVRRERAERKVISDLQDFIVNISDQKSNAPKLINEERQTDLETRVTQLLAPVIPEAPKQKNVGESAKDPYVLPLSANYNIQTGVMAVAGGYWQEGADGDWRQINPQTATGTRLYLKFSQDEGGSITSMQLEVRASSYDGTFEFTEGTGGAMYASEVRVLLAEVSGGVLIQRRHGNFTLGLQQIDGTVTRWPEMVGGSRPPLPPP